MLWLMVLMGHAHRHVCRRWKEVIAHTDYDYRNGGTYQKADQQPTGPLNKRRGRVFCESNTNIQAGPRQRNFSL